MQSRRAAVEALLHELFDQLPTMQVRQVTLSPPEPASGDQVIARVDVGEHRKVLCTIAPDGTLLGAQVLED